MFLQDSERQQAQIGIVVEFAIALIGKLDGINRHSFNSFRLRVGECLTALAWHVLAMRAVAFSGSVIMTLCWTPECSIYLTSFNPRNTSGRVSENSITVSVVTAALTQLFPHS